MALKSNQTITRDVTSETQGGLSELISRAFSSGNEAYGYTAGGTKVFDSVGGTNQVTTVGVKWRESQAETKQKFLLDLSPAYVALDFTGSPAVAKQERITISGTTSSLGGFSSTTLTYRINGVDRVLNLSSATRSYTAAVVRAIIQEDLNREEVNTVNTAASPTGLPAAVDIVYFASAGDVTIGSTVTVYDGVSTSTFTTASSNVTSFKATSNGATVNLEVTANIAQSGNKAPEISSTSSFNVVDGGSLHWYDIANELTGFLDTAVGVESRTTGTDGYLYTLDSGYAVSSFVIRISRVRGGVTTTSDVTAAVTVPHVNSVTETYGTLRILIQDPVDDEVHTLVVATAENTPITNIGKIIDRAVKNDIIGTDELGNDRYLSSIVDVAVSDITPDQRDDDSETTSNFVITFTFGNAGAAAAVSTVTTGMNAIASDFVTITDSVSGGNPSANITGIDWDHVSTSSTLQPGGDTTHFATLVFTKPTP